MSEHSLGDLRIFDWHVPIIDRAARGIFEARKAQAPCEGYPVVMGKWGTLPAELTARYRFEANVVLTAIRQPTSGMISAGLKCESNLLWRVYASMIEAALAEKELNREETL